MKGPDGIQVCPKGSSYDLGGGMFRPSILSKGGGWILWEDLPTHHFSECLLLTKKLKKIPRETVETTHPFDIESTFVQKVSSSFCRMAFTFDEETSQKHLVSTRMSCCYLVTAFIEVGWIRGVP